MNYQWFVAISGLFDWLLLSIALFVISGKLGWKKKWPAWVPGYRIYCLGDSVGLSREGMYCGVMDLLFVISVVTDYAVKEKEAIGTLASLVHLVMYVFLFIYRLRIYMQILKLFGLSKKWVILWLVANWLPLMIIGLGSKYQPQRARLMEGDAEGPGAAGMGRHTFDDRNLYCCCCHCTEVY